MSGLRCLETTRPRRAEVALYLVRGASGTLHEAVPGPSSQDGLAGGHPALLTSTVGFGLGLALAAAGARAVAWVCHDSLDSDRGRLDGSGLLSFGAGPERVLVTTLRRAEDVLQAALEAARCPGLGAALVELGGDGRAADFTATRRLALAAKASGVAVVLVRATPFPGASAAAARWAVEPAPSTPLEAGAPGHPAFRVTLLRHRGGAPERTLRLEWSRDQQSFVAAPLLGAVVPAPADRPAQEVAGRWLALGERRAG